MLNRYSIAILTAVLTGVATVHAQNRYADTFLLTVADKTPEHPHYGEGHSQGYVVNGVQSPTITLVRDSLYLFSVRGLPDQASFHFYTAPIGGSLGIYSEHVESSTSGLWVVKATDETPDTLYYASSEEPWMGGTVLIVDSITSSVERLRERSQEATRAGVGAYPNPFVEETDLRFTLDAPSAVHIQVVDALGQIVLTHDAGTMEPGAARIRLNAGDLDAGVYLYRIEAVSAGRRSVATGKVQVM